VRFCGAPLAIDRPMRGLTTKPWSARRSASENSRFQGSLPCLPWARPSMATAPGTPVASPLITASRNDTGLPPSMNMSGLAPEGAVSRPL
jgi:hypothetical protein